MALAAAQRRTGKRSALAEFPVLGEHLAPVLEAWDQLAALADGPRPADVRAWCELRGEHDPRWCRWLWTCIAALQAERNLVQAELSRGDS